MSFPGCFSTDTRTIGHDLSPGGVHSNVADHIACQDICKATTDCQSFSYHVPPHKICYLKTAAIDVIGTNAEAEWTSGPDRCT